MANENYISAINADGLVLPVKAAAVYTAQENSLFLGGQLIPLVAAPGGIAHFPVLGETDADKISAETNADVESEVVSVTKNATTVDLYASRAVVRDLGNIDPAEIGRVLGNAVAKKFDQGVMDELDGATASTSDSFPMTVNAVFDAVEQIRGNGEMGQLTGIVNPAAGMELLKLIGTNAYAGGDLQTEALRNGFVGNLGGVNFFMSAYVDTANTSGYIFGADAMRIAMQKNVDIEVQRRAAAVGVDVVASLHAASKLIDANRAVKLINV
jgi:hypothetical protein